MHIVGNWLIYGFQFTVNGLDFARSPKTPVLLHCSSPLTASAICVVLCGTRTFLRVTVVNGYQGRERVPSLQVLNPPLIIPLADCKYYNSSTWDQGCLFHSHSTTKHLHCSMEYSIAFKLYPKRRKLERILIWMHRYFLRMWWCIKFRRLVLVSNIVSGRKDELNVTVLQKVDLKIDV